MADQETPAIKALGNEIAKGEGGYKSYNTGTVKGKGVIHSGIKEDMFSLSVDQLHESSKLSPYDRNRVFAAGKYQIITDTATGTLIKAKSAMKLKGSEKFTPELQESIFAHFLIGPIKRPALDAYIQRGEGTIEDAVYDAAKEWASIEVPQGRSVSPKVGGYISHGTESYYQKKGTNSAIKGSGAKIRAKIEAVRAEVVAAKSSAGGKLPDTQRAPIVDASQEAKPVDVTEEAPTPEAPRRDADGYRGFTLTGSVGKSGDNHHDDVIAVQTRLAFFGIHTKADGKYGADTQRAITAFQKPFGIHDGLIEVGKKSAKELFSGQVTVDAKINGVEMQAPTKQTTPPTKKTSGKPEVERATTPQPKQTKPPKPEAQGGWYMFGKYRSSQPAGNTYPEYTGGASHQSSIGTLHVQPNVKLTPNIIQAATVIAKYLPRSTVMTSGWRNDEDQARVIAQKHALVDNDVWKTWQAAVAAKVKINWVGKSNHRPGNAMDLSGAPLGQIQAAVLKAKAEHPEAKIDNTFVEGGGQNCLHVNLKG